MNVDVPKCNITNGIPSEIYVAIGRGRYEDDALGEYRLAEDVAQAVRHLQKTEIERLQGQNADLRMALLVHSGKQTTVSETEAEAIVRALQLLEMLPSPSS